MRQKGTDMPLSAVVKGSKIFVNLPVKAKEYAALVSRARLVPCGVLLGNGGMMYPNTLIVARRLRKQFGSDLTWHGECAELVKWLERYDLAHRYKAEADLPDVPNERHPSWAHQRRGFWFGANLPAFLLDEKMGAGKTKQAIDILCHWGARKVLTITTASAVPDWPKHLETHATLPYVALPLAQRHLNATRKAERLESAYGQNEYLWAALSYDLFWHPPLGHIIKRRDAGAPGTDIGLLARLPWDAIIFDEIHALADFSGRRSLFAYRLGQRIPRRIGLTGTIVRHKIHNIFGPFRALDVGIFGDNPAEFLERYAIFNRESAEKEDKEARDLLGPRYIVGYRDDRMPELADLMRTITYHCPTANLDLPEPTFAWPLCYPSLTALRHYKELESSFVTTVGSREIEARNVLVQLLRLEQIACGFIGDPVIDPDTGEIDFINEHEIDSAKEELLEQTLTEIEPDDSVIVVCRFRHDLKVIKRVCERIGRTYYEQSGKRKQRQKWQAANGGEVLGGQIASTCEAIDLTRSHYMLIFSTGFSLYQYQQMLARIDRPGQRYRPHYRHLIADLAIEHKKYKALANNKDAAQELMDLVRRGAWHDDEDTPTDRRAAS